jgi:hypothetical protein
VNRRPTYGDDAEYDNWVEGQIDPAWTGEETDRFGWMADRAADRYERSRDHA